jgi:hypothetical protein
MKTIKVATMVAYVLAYMVGFFFLDTHLGNTTVDGLLLGTFAIVPAGIGGALYYYFFFENPKNLRQV